MDGAYFNPRHPHGWRQKDANNKETRFKFQSTPPTRVATSVSDFTDGVIFDFNPRHPHGWRLAFLAIPYLFLNFNPRHPHGWRPDGV